MTYTPTAWVDYGVPCIDAATLNNMEAGIDRAQGDVMVLRGATAAIPASDPLLVGRLYFETDGRQRIWRDNGAAWQFVGYAGFHHRYLWSTPEFTVLQNLTMNVAGLVYLSPLDVPFGSTVDRIIPRWSGVVAGNVRVGIYEEGGVDTPQGGDLLVESASTVVAGINRWQLIAVADTVLSPGQYYIAIQSQGVGCRIISEQDAGSSFAYNFNNSIGYGAFDDPCPVVAMLDRIPRLGIRLASVP